MKKKSLYKFLIIYLTIISCKMDKNILTIGHRGAAGYVTENTLESIEKAINLGIDAVEIDVFLCKSGELVVFHDRNLDRLTNAVGPIEAIDLDSIKKIEVLGGFKIPTLNEVLNLIEGKIILNIELKGSHTAISTNQLLITYFKEKKIHPTKILISSFDWNELEIFYNLNKEVPLAVLTSDDPINAIPFAKKIKAIAINVDYELLNFSNVKKIHSENLKIYAWTVNKKNEIKELIDLGVDGIISDFPDRIQFFK
jgi:glycerophosphoryl diester phosphodiesterase